MTDISSRLSELTPAQRKLLALKLKQKAGAAEAPAAAGERPSVFPASFAQRRMWLLDRLEPGSTAYSLPKVWRIPGPLDAAALERALGELVARHETLRTRRRGALAPAPESAIPSPVPGQGVNSAPACTASGIAEQTQRDRFGVAQAPRHSTSPGTGEVASLSEPERALSVGITRRRGWGRAPRAAARRSAPRERRGFRARPGPGGGWR